MGNSADKHQGADEWMGLVDDNRRINQLCIPGTHDTMAMYDSITSKVAGSLGTCQNDTLNEQLRYGCRAFDIRLVHTGENNLQCYHGKWGAKGVDQQVNFMEVCDIFNKFLSEHPTEMIIAKIKRESKNKDLVDPPPFDQIVYNNLIESKLPYWIPGSGSNNTSTATADKKEENDKDDADNDKGVETKYDNNNNEDNGSGKNKDEEKESDNNNNNNNNNNSNSADVNDTFNNYKFPTLGECRGKVIILTAFPFSGKVPTLGYVFKEMAEEDDKGSKKNKKKGEDANWQGKFYFENDWKGPNKTTKLRKIKKHLRKARKQDGDIFYVSYMSATKAVSVTKCRCQAMDNPKDYSRSLGPKMEKYLNNNCCGKDPPGIGIIFFDFGLLPNHSCKISCCNAIALATCTPTIHCLRKYNMYSAVYNVNFREQIPWPRTRCCLYVTCCCWLWDVICCPSICLVDCDHDRWVC